MSSDGSDVGVQLDRARALCDLKRYAEATELLRQVLEREPESEVAWCLLAQAQLGAGDPHAALDAAGHAAALEPENDWPHRLRSFAFQRLGASESAIAAAREAVRTGPSFWGSHVCLANSLALGKRDLDEAAASGERGVELAPHEPATHFTRGIVAGAQGHHWEADQHYRQALALDPQHLPSQNAIAARRLAKSGFDPGALADAAAGFRNVVQTDPREDVGVYNLELALRVFLARLSYLIFVVAIISARVDDPTSGTGNATAARIVPLVLALVPLAYAAYFLVELEPDLRGHLFYVAFHGRLAAASLAQVCAVVLLLASAAVPRHAAIVMAVAAVVSSLIARILVASGGKARPWSVVRWRRRRLSLDRRWIMVAVVVGTILFLSGHK